MVYNGEVSVLLKFIYLHSTLSYLHLVHIFFPALPILKNIIKGVD